MAKQVPEEYADHLRKRGFEVQRVLGTGLSGVVLLAEQPSLGRRVAVKVCDGLIASKSEQLRKRFVREARLLSKINHPGIPYVLTTGIMPNSDMPYMVMQFIDGATLRQRLKEESRLDPEVALEICAQVLEALHAAHCAKVIHRDVKPENIMLASGTTYLIDFSIGFSTEGESGLTRTTGAGERLGTLDYRLPRTIDEHARRRCTL
jgi:serine/threonine-protein kinase